MVAQLRTLTRGKISVRLAGKLRVKKCAALSDKDLIPNCRTSSLISHQLSLIFETPLYP